MDFPTLLSILWRRWFVVLPIALLTVATGVVVATSGDVLYETDGSELLVTRRQTGEGSSTTPSLSAEQLSSLVADSLLTPEFELELREAGFTSDYEATADFGDSTITVTVTGEDPDDVFEMAEAVISGAPSATESFLGPDAAATVNLSPLRPTTQDQIVEQEDSFVLSVPLVAWTSAADVSNPFPVGNSTLRTLAEMASRSELANAVEEAVPSGSFSVSSEPRPTAPIISIGASADDPSDVVRVYEIVRADLAQQLMVFQTSAGVEPEDQTVLLQLVPPESIEQTRGSTVRAAVSIVLLGLGFACLVAILIDVMAQRRKSHRSAGRRAQVTLSMPPSTTPSYDEPSRSEQQPPVEASAK